MAVDLTVLNMQLYLYILTFTLFFGTIGSISNTIIFSRKNLRRFPCSLYYLTQSIICSLFLYTAILLRYLAIPFQIDFPSRSAYTCKFFLYVSNTFRCLSALFIVWASVDRYLVSSSSERLRRLSQVKYTVYSICLTTITIAILFIYVLIYFGASPTLNFTCNSTGYGTVTVVNSILNALILVLFVPLMLISFSILTVKNIHRRRQLVHPTNTTAQQHQDIHMTRLMLSQSFVYLILVFPSSIFNIYYAFLPSPTSVQLTFIYKLLFLVQYVHPSTAFYVNTLVSRTYRHEVLKILNNVVKRVFHSTIIERHMLQRGRRQRQTAIINARSARQMETKF